MTRISDSDAQVAIVCQRFGAGVVGGAEAHAALLARQLMRESRAQVQIYTTCAQDSSTWANHFAPGAHLEDGILVKRFSVVQTRRPWIKRFLTLALHFTPKGRILRTVRLWLEDAWIKAQGPVAPDLIDALMMEHKRFDLIIAMTYLYWPTIRTIENLPGQVVLIPTAHREFPMTFLRSRQTLEHAKLLATNSAAEERLLMGLNPAFRRTIRRVGIAIPAAPSQADTPDPRNAPLEHLERERPLLLYCGRIGRSKKVDALISAFLAALKLVDTTKQPHLVLIGALEGRFRVPEHPRIHYLGTVPDAVKFRALAAAAWVVNPSPKESLSLLVLEALQAKKTVLVNLESDVLADYAASLPEVYGYRGHGHFVQLLTQAFSGELQPKILLDSAPVAPNAQQEVTLLDKLLVSHP